MKRFSEQLQKKAKSLRLSMTEKRDLRDRVVSYMEYHPLPLELKEIAPTLGKEVNTSMRLVQVNGWRILQGMGAVISVLVLSVTYLAEQAVPGDSLYAVKVSFNEEVRGTLARGSYEKIVWETERLNRRIAEARLLASEGRLTEAVEVEVANAVREHSETARREIEILKETDKEEATLASIQLETTIDVQTTALTNDIKGEIERGEETKTSLIAEALEDSQMIANTVVTETETLPSYVRLTAHVEQETTRAYELLKSVSKNATTEEQVDIERRLIDIGRSINEASLHMEVDESKARYELVDVLERTQRLIVFMTNIDVRHSVTVEEIVPVTFTIEERNNKVRLEAEEVMTLYSIIVPQLDATGTLPELKDKLAPAVEESFAIASSALLQLPQGEEAGLTSLEQAVASALAVMRDSATALNLTDKVMLPDVDQASLDVEETASSTATTSLPILESEEDTQSSSTEDVTVDNPASEVQI